MCERDAMKELLSIFARSIFIAPLLLTWPAGAQEHRFEDDPVTCFRSYSASWEIHAFCSPANASRCVPEIRSASTRGVVLTSASIRTTGRRPANGRTRRRYRNERERCVGDRVRRRLFEGASLSERFRSPGSPSLTR